VLTAVPSDPNAVAGEGHASRGCDEADRGLGAVVGGFATETIVNAVGGVGAAVRGARRAVKGTVDMVSAAVGAGAVAAGRALRWALPPYGRGACRRVEFSLRGYQSILVVPRSAVFFFAPSRTHSESRENITVKTKTRLKEAFVAFLTAAPDGASLRRESES